MKRALLIGASCAVLLAARSAFALGPFEKNDPRVQTGLDAYNKGDYAGALKSFEDAQKSPELKDNPAVEFDRGNALYKLDRLEDAKQAYHHVIESETGTLREKDYYNLGNAFAQLKDKQEAVSAYRKALTLDPNDESARHNLEVVLRDLKKPQQPQKNDGGQDGGGQDGGRDGGQDGGQKGDGGQKDGGQDGGRGDGGQDGGRGDGGQKGDGGQGDGGQDGGNGQGAQGGAADGGRGDGGSADAGATPQKPEPQDAGNEGTADEGLEDGGTAEGSLNKADVERLLNAMKQSEQNLQLWRFQQKKKPRNPNAKDW